jgi:hypothetical protein
MDGAADFGWLIASLSADGDPLIRRVGGLAELRVLDILVWTLGSPALD